MYIDINVSAKRSQLIHNVSKYRGNNLIFQKKKKKKKKIRSALRFLDGALFKIPFATANEMISLLIMTV